MMKTMHHPNREAGFTLLELLLTIGLMGLMLAGMYQIMDNWQQRAVDRIAAADMMRVQNAAQDYVTANFDVIKTEPAGVFTEIDMNDLRSGNYLPTGYQPRNVFRQSIRVFRRNLQVTRLNKDNTPAVDSSGNPVKITTVEVVTVSDNPAGGTIRVANKRLLDAAQAAGPKMGMVSNMVMPGASYANLATSAHNEWFVTLSDLAAAGYTATPDSMGGYLAAYGLVNTEKTDANDSWLYRVTVDGRPELNRMATTLNMNAQRVENVGSFVADRVNVTGNAAFRGIGQGTSSGTSQAMTVEQALRVDSAGESRINMRSTDTATCTLVDIGGGNRTVSGAACSAAGQVVGGELQVVSGPSNATMAIGTLTADGSVITDYTDVDTMTDSRGVTSFENVTGLNMNVSTTFVAPTTNVTGATIQTQQLQTATMSVTNGANIGNAAEPTIKLVAAQVNTGGTGNAASRTMTSTQMDLGNAATFSGNIIAEGINATESVYLENMTGGYNDTVINNTVVCAVAFPINLHGRAMPSSPLTYCHPVGRTSWQGDKYREDCTSTSTGYSCDHSREIAPSTYQLFGHCVHTYALGASNQAYYDTSCS